MAKKELNMVVFVPPFYRTTIVLIEQKINIYMAATVHECTQHQHTVVHLKVQYILSFLHVSHSIIRVYIAKFCAGKQVLNNWRFFFLCIYQWLASQPDIVARLTP